MPSSIYFYIWKNKFEIAQYIKGFKNGYSDLVVMSSELYDSFVRENSIDYAIHKAEKEFAETGEAVDAKTAFEELEKKHFG